MAGRYQDKVLSRRGSNHLEYSRCDLAPLVRHVHPHHILSSQDLPVGPVEAGQHQHQEGSPREVSEVKATLGLFFYFVKDFKCRRKNCLNLTSLFFQEVEHMDDLHSDTIEQTHDNGLQRTDFVVEVRKKWILIRS